MGMSTISMAIFNSYVKLPKGKHHKQVIFDGLEESNSWSHGLAQLISPPPGGWRDQLHSAGLILSGEKFPDWGWLGFMMSIYYEYI